MALKWYELRHKDGRTISIKGRFEAEAIHEAADRWECGAEEVICVGHKPYNTFLSSDCSAGLGDPPPGWMMDRLRTINGQ